MTRVLPLLLLLVVSPLLLLSLGCAPTQKAQKQAVTARNDSLLLGTWRHSHEEDRDRTDGARTYRNAKTFTFPPSRGRTGFTFLPDEQCFYLAIAPTDGTDQQPGRYGWGGKNHLKITLENGQLMTLRVKELTAVKLVVVEE